MVSMLLVGTVVMGAFVLGVGTFVVRSRRWHHYTPHYRPEEMPTRPGGAIAALAGQTWLWVATFLVLAVAIGGVALAFVVLPDGATAGLALGILGAVLIGAYIVLGVYVSAKNRGHPRSIAAAESAVTFGILFLIAVVGQIYIS